MKSIIHISADFPDPLVPAKTRAVANLVEAAEGFRNVVYSLNRVSWRRGVELFPFAEDRIALAYGAPPYGLNLTRTLAAVSDAITRDLERCAVFPALIHAHKFSVEGLVAQAVAERLGTAFIAGMWGDTDIKIFEAKRGLRGRYRKIATEAACLLPAAPWTGDYFRAALDLDPTRFEVLPVITGGDAMLQPRITGEPQLVSVFALDSWNRKNLDTMSRAVARLAPELPGLSLDIYGMGSPASFLDASRAIRDAGVEKIVRLRGRLEHADVQTTINRYAAFILPPRRETFGMVHVEAVLAGVPILWSRGRGIDGLLDGLHVGYRCDPSSVDDVADGIRYLMEHERSLKQSIKTLQAERAFDHLRRADIAARYRAILRRLTATPVQSRSPISVGMR